MNALPSEGLAADPSQVNAAATGRVPVYEQVMTNQTDREM